jgi:hypothetical protein
MPAIEASHSRSTSACAADMLVELVKRGGRPTLHTSSYFGGMLRRRTIRLPTGTRSAGILGPAPTRTRPLPRSDFPAMWPPSFDLQAMLWLPATLH